MNSRALSPRAKRRRRLQQRQTVIFGTIIAALVFVTGFAWLTYTGVIPSPWTRDISYPDKLETSDEMVCPPEGAYTVDFSEITANVYNGSDQGGLATSISTNLREAGVTVDEVGNWPSIVLSDGQIQTGVSGIVAAYTIQQIFPEWQVMIDDRQTATIDVIPGHYYSDNDSLAADDFEAGTAIEPPSACVPEEDPEDGGEGDDSVPSEEELEDDGDSDDDSENQDA